MTPAFLKIIHIHLQGQRNFSYHKDRQENITHIACESISVIIVRIKRVGSRAMLGAEPGTLWALRKISSLFSSSSPARSSCLHRINSVRASSHPPAGAVSSTLSQSRQEPQSFSLWSIKKISLIPKTKHDWADKVPVGSRHFQRMVRRRDL